MTLHYIDWLILATYLLAVLVVGLYFSRRGTKNVDEFFVAGRNLPWWLAGITMAASAFAIDTPLGILGLVAKEGIPGVWYAWAYVLGGAGALGAFIFASLLRRSEVITNAELIELRYSGKPAAFLRGFKGIYFGIFSNAITMGWVIKAVFTINKDVLGFNPHFTLAFILILTLVYTALSGLWGIVATDFVQFIVGIIGVFTLAIMAWNHIGGLDQIMEGMVSRYGEIDATERMSFFPSFSSPFFITFITFVTLKWWANPPAAIHQRIVASKNERHASFSTLFFAITAFAINYWPMIVIAIISLVMFPQLKNAESGYGMLMVKLIPTGLLGLMLASMVAAFMSTIDTHLNYGASYMVNDIYRRFIKRKASTKHYVRASQISTVIMLAFAVIVAYSLDSVQQAWYFISMLVTSYGLLMVIRWFWWRINPWSEITCLATSGIGSLILSSKVAKFFGYWETIYAWGYGWRYLTLVLFTTVCWLVVTYFTKPSDEKVLISFCKKVKPFPTFWGPIKKRTDIDWNPYILRCSLHWLFGTVGIFCICFGIGSFIFKNPYLGSALLASACVIFTTIFFTWKDV